MGLAQRDIERAGFTTVAVSNIPELTMAVSVPRLLGIEHPFGQTMGKPGDRETQRAVLLAAIEAVEQMQAPGSFQHLQFEWTGPAEKPHTPPPIVEYLKWHPWDLPRLFSRDVPKPS